MTDQLHIESGTSPPNASDSFTSARSGPKALGQGDELKGASEDRALQAYQAEGWNGLRKGAPDLLLYKVENGILLLKFVEVKSDGDRLSPSQKKYLELLHSVGLDASTLWLRTNTEVPGSGNALVTKHDITVPADFDIEFEIDFDVRTERTKSRQYARTEDGGFISTSPRRKDVVLYQCPVCKGLKIRNREKIVCRHCHDDLHRALCKRPSLITLVLKVIEISHPRTTKAPVKGGS